MNTNLPNQPRLGLFRSWLSLAGLVICGGGLFCFFLLFLLDSLSHFANPYIGILTYLVSPFFVFLGLAISVAGVLWRRHELKIERVTFQVDLTRPRDRRMMGLFVGASVLFLLVSSVLSYHTYHYTESVQFCGQACHTVMKPELVTYSHGPHARVACVSCHIGPGAKWYVKSKLSGMYQVYAVAFDKYPRPVPTPVKNLRPAQDTCEQCHWPKNFVGNLDRTFNYFLGDATNTPFTVRLTIKVGGGDPTSGPVGGIHWHMSVGNTVEYIATDDARQKIPWVRVTDAQGAQREYRTRTFTNSISGYTVRTMDCMDCHNRPAHTYQSPDGAVNLAMALGQIDPTLPWIKTNAVFVLTRPYTNETQALQGIATLLADRYPAGEHLRKSIDAVQQIYKDNFFPEMKASWRNYPNNIGHKDWPGCFRCHDGLHKTADGKGTIKANDCNACHTILAQGQGAELNILAPNGEKFKHPGDEVDGACTDCHNGGGL